MRPPEKTEQSDKIQSDTDAYLKAGNQIEQVPIGASKEVPLKVIYNLARARGQFKANQK